MIWPIFTNPAFWGVAISAVGNFLGNRKSANASTDASQAAVDAARINSETNWKIAEMNAALEQGRFEEAMAWAKQIREEEKMGYGDAYGNQVYFDPNLGWQILKTPQTQQIIDASTRQEILNRTELDRNNREREARDAQFQRGEQLIADRLMNDYNNLNRINPTQLGSMLYGAGQQARNEQADYQAQQDNITSARQRNLPGFQRAQNERARQSNRDAQTAGINSYLQGLTGASELDNAMRNNTANQYFSFRNRSVQPWESSFSPTTVGQLSSGSTAGGNNLLQSALGQNVAQYPYQQTDFSGAFNTLAQGNAQASLYKDLAGLIGAGASIYDTYSQGQRQIGNDLDELMRTRTDLF